MFLFGWAWLCACSCCSTEMGVVVIVDGSDVVVTFVISNM